jgi:hypothetical protein
MVNRLLKSFPLQESKIRGKKEGNDAEKKERERKREIEMVQADGSCNA